MSRICVLDTETTGFDPETADVVEYAHVVLDSDTGRALGWTERLCCPGHPIPPEARAVHHISDEDVRGKTTCAEYIGQRDWSQVDYFAAHNAPFDRGFLPLLPERPWICTWRCASHLLPEAPGHSNQVLRYWLEDMVSPAWPPFRAQFDGLQFPHRALYDACVTAGILRHLLTLTGGSVEELARLSTAPLILEKCKFGKHRDTPWAEVPRDYLRWMLRQGDDAWDSDVIHTVRYHLGLLT